jgi:hypothetical protein
MSDTVRCISEQAKSMDILVVADGKRIIQHVRHTAIYEPRLGPAPPDTA